METTADAYRPACLHGLARERARGDRADRTAMSSGEDYPRDLIGYGSHPPDPCWPGQARIAVSLVLNYEEGGESCVLHGDAHSESVLTDLGASEALPGARNLNVESIYEYGSRVGFWEIMRLLKRLHATATVYAVGMASSATPRLQRRSPRAASRSPATDNAGSIISSFPRTWSARTCCATLRASPGSSAASRSAGTPVARAP